MAGEQIFNAKDEKLGNLATYSISTGLNSPYPTDGSGTYPNLSATVVSPAPLDMIFEANKEVRLTGSYQGANSGGVYYGTRDLFKGKLASAKSSEASGATSLGVDGIASRMNQSISTYPIIENPGGAVQKKLSYALLHWMSECDIFRWDHPGVMEFQVQNIKYGIGYYNQLKSRLYGVHVPDGVNSVTSWVPTAGTDTTAETQSEGIPFVIGDKLHLGAIFPFYSSAQPNQRAIVSLNSVVEASGVSYNNPEIEVAFDRAANLLRVYEKTGTTSQQIHSFAIPADVSKARVDIELHRTSATQVVYTTKCVMMVGSGGSYSPVTTNATYTRNNTWLPTSLRIGSVDITSTSADFQGIDSVYLVRTDVFMPDNDTEWAISYTADPLPSIPSGAKVTIPGLVGSGWDLVNELCSLYGLAFEPATMTIRNATALASDYGAGWAILGPVILDGQAREMAETVEVVNYNYTESLDSQTPVELWRADSTYAVARGERQEHDIKFDGSAAFLFQPTVTSTNNFTNSRNNGLAESLYCVFGADNTPVSAAEWTDSGGFIRFELTGVPGELKLIIQAPNAILTKASPYTISLEGTIPALVVSGIGVRSRAETLTSYTGAGKVPKTLGTTYDSPLVCATWLAWNAAAALAVLHGTTVTEASASYANAYRPDEFPPQAPYYIRKQGALYRVSTSTLTQTHTTINSAQRFVRCSDVNAEYLGLTCAEVNTLFAGKDINYNNLAPLRRYID